MRNMWNWILVIGGGVMIIAEILLGAGTGFDLALLGVALAAGGGVGLFFGSTKIGLFAAGALALIYFVFLRKWVKSKLSSPDQPSNVDALRNRAGVVVVRITIATAGQVKLGDEIWRAALAPGAGEAREPGEMVTVESVDGVTLIVR